MSAHIRKSSILLLVFLVLLLTSCSKKDDGLVPKTDEPQGPQYAQASGDGYAFEYDAALFSADGADSWTYTGEGSPMPVYLAVQKYEDLTARELAEGLVLQSGMDGVTVEDTTLGPDSLPAKTVELQQEVEEVTQFQHFYALDLDFGSLLVEAGSYNGAPREADEALSRMLDTFRLTA